MEVIAKLQASTIISTVCVGDRFCYTALNIPKVVIMLWLYKHEQLIVQQLHYKCFFNEKNTKQKSNKEKKCVWQQEKNTYPAIFCYS